jgi:hypothetical protein
MPEPIAGTSIYLLPGMSVKITSPVSYNNNNGYYPMIKAVPKNFFPSKDPKTGNFTPKNGFVLEDEEVGTLEIADDNTLSVIYRHKKAATNAIWFFALTGERALVNVISVPIHDHSSIVQGGPAYGTYFSDDEEANT